MALMNLTAIRTLLCIGLWSTGIRLSIPHFYVGLPAMAAKQRIAFVANTSWSIYKFRLYLIERLLKEGFAIFVLAPRDAYTQKFEGLQGLTYVELYHFRGKSISLVQDFLLCRELLKHYRSLRPDIIFHYTVKANVYGTRAAARARIPSVSVITGLGYTFTSNGWLQVAVRLMYKWALRWNAEVWVLNEDDRKILGSKRLADPRKIFLLPGEGVDTAGFFPAPFKDSKKEITFLFVGRMIRHKGINEFVHAAELLKKEGLQINCQLLGFFDDNPAAIHRHQVEEWSRRGIVKYLGHTDRVADFMEQADCIVLPSYYGEGMPMSLLEGASMCKALIAADSSGCRTLIDNGINGFLCREKDSVDLAGKMNAYYRLTADAKKQMGMEGRNRVLKHYSQEIVAAIYLDKIGKLGKTQ